MSLASDRPEFIPPSSSGRGRAIVMAVLAHLLLIAALTWGVGWKRVADNAPIQAELWSTTVLQAAPALQEPLPKVTPLPSPEPTPEPKVEPPPPPPKAAKPVKVAEPEPEPTPKVDPQIAIEKAKKEEKKKLEKKLAEEKELAKKLAKKETEKIAEKIAEKAAEKEAKEKARLEKIATDKAQKVADAKAKAKSDAADDAKAEAVRAANLKRIAGLAGASGGETATGTAKQSTGPSAGYAGRVVARIKPNIVFTEDIATNPTSIVEVKCAPDGRIISRRTVKSSGIKSWDEAVLRAIDKAEIMPRDLDGTVPSSFEISFRPRD